jgi:hypothetical protein
MKNKIKDLLLISIFISILFSSIWFTNAQKMNDVLNIHFWVEKIEYELSELPKRNFRNSKLQEKYTEMKILNKILTNAFYKEYTNWNIDYYTTKWIIKNHQNLIYHTKKLFTYFELKIENSKYVEVDEKILNSYSQIRISYNRIIFLYNKSKK